MELKRIIKEEINDFEWADGVKLSMGSDYHNLKMGDLVTVTGRVQPRNPSDRLSRGYEFNGNVGMVISPSDYFNPKRSLHSKGSIVIAFDEDWGTQGFSVLGPHTHRTNLHPLTWINSLRRLINKTHNIEEKYCVRGNCYVFTDLDIKGGISIEPFDGEMKLDVSNNIPRFIEEEIQKLNVIH